MEIEEVMAEQLETGTGEAVDEAEGLTNSNEGVETDADSSADLATDDSAQGTDGEDLNAEPTFSVTVGEEKRQFSRSEAEELIKSQLEMQENLLPQLRFLAAQKGQALNDFVKGVVEATETMRRNELMERTNNDTELVERLMKAEKDDVIKKIEESAKSKADVSKSENTAKLAEGLSEINKLFPEIDSIEKIPALVVKDALSKNTSLTESYLRFRLSEERKNAAANKAAKAAANTSGGSLESKKEENGEGDALLRAMRQAFS